jgi:hypothetical protein
MKRTLMAVMVAGILLLASSGSTLAAGKLGGAGGADEFRRPNPVMAGSKLGVGIESASAGPTAVAAGKLGGASGGVEHTREVAPAIAGGKLGGSLDRPLRRDVILTAGKLGGASGAD